MIRLPPQDLPHRQQEPRGGVPGGSEGEADVRTTRLRFRCVACGFEEHTDLVGTINVRRAGQARIAGEMKDAVESLSAGTRRNDLRLRIAA